jgi:predicted nucleotidyltransferase
MNKINNNLLDLIKAKISKKNPKAEVFLFGSRTRGQEYKNSDWDILILLDKPNVDRETEKEYREEIFEVELETGEPISTFIYSKQDWEDNFSVTPFFQNIKKDGVLL